MANSSRGAIPLQAGDVEYTVSYSVNALCELEDAFGVPINKVLKLFEKPDAVRMGDVRKLIRCGLSDHHADVDDRKAGEIATQASVSTCMAAVTRAFALAFPEAKDEGNPPKARDSAR